MKICITSQGNTLESLMDTRFGRAKYFLIYDTETKETIFLKNDPQGGGAGVSAGQLMVNNDVKAIITGNIGPNAFQILKSGNIQVLKGTYKTLKENIEQYHKLSMITETVKDHSGIRKAEV